MADYLHRLLNREAFDRKGADLRHGPCRLQHQRPRAPPSSAALWSVWPRRRTREEEFAIYAMVERMAPEIISRERKIYKGVSPNVDFYSGLTYSMLGIPEELFTPPSSPSLASWAGALTGWSGADQHGQDHPPRLHEAWDRREYVRIDDRG